MDLLLAALLLLQDRGIDELIEKLRSDKIEERNDAAAELRKRGEAALPLLEKASRDPNNNLSDAAKELIKDIRDPLHAESAEETFRKMDEAIRTAKTIRVTVRFDFTRGEKKPDFAARPGAAVLLKGEDRVAMEPAAPADPNSKEIEKLVSDGKEVHGARGYPPKVFRDDVITGFTRSGLGLTLYIDASTRIRAEQPRGNAVEVEISTPTLKGQDALGRMLAYRATFSNREVVDVVLWCDPKTRLPRQIIASTQGQGENRQHFCDRYEDWVLNADIPDEKFTQLASEVSQAAKVATTRRQLAAMTNALGMYEIDSGAYPTTEQGLAALSTAPKGAKGWKGPYLAGQGVPSDPWGNPYVFRYPGQSNPATYDLLSCGPDGKEGTDDDVFYGRSARPREKR